MRNPTPIRALLLSSMLTLGIGLVAGGCGGDAPPPMPKSSPYDQAKQSFDSYKAEMMKRQAGHGKAAKSPGK